MTKRRKLLMRAAVVLALGLVGLTAPRTADAAAMECYAGTICADSCDPMANMCVGCPEGIYQQCQSPAEYPYLGCWDYEYAVYCGFMT